MQVSHAASPCPWLAEGPVIAGRIIADAPTANASPKHQRIKV